MKCLVAAAAALAAMLAADPAAAALSVGAEAPELSAPGARDGTLVTVDLAKLLEQGPVVLYFFPSAFTDDAESRAFAESFDQFRAAGAQVVGMSRDSIETLVRFSRDAAGGKFPVASADESLVNAFDVNDGAMFNTRTTYVIDQSGKIVFVHDANEYRDHIKRSLAFVEEMRQ